MTTTSARFEIQQAFHRVSTEFGAARAHVGGWAARLRTICVSAFGDAYFDRRSRRQYRVQVIDGSSARITGESIWQLASTLPAEPRVAHVSASVLPFCLVDRSRARRRHAGAPAVSLPSSTRRWTVSLAWMPFIVAFLINARRQAECGPARA